MMNDYTLHLGDCIEYMRAMPDKAICEYRNDARSNREIYKTKNEKKEKAMSKRRRKKYVTKLLQCYHRFIMSDLDLNNKHVRRFIKLNKFYIDRLFKKTRKNLTTSKKYET